MRVDALLNFIPIGSPLSLVGGSGVSFRAPKVIDLLGFGVGVPIPATINNPTIIGNVTTWGSPDAGGVGGIRPELDVVVGTAAVANAGTPTLNVQLQAAADDGTGNPSTYQTLGESGTITVAQLIAGRRIFRSPWLPPFPGNLRPRFISLNFLIPAATSFTALTIASALVTPLRDDPFQLQAARNYTVA